MFMQTADYPTILRFVEDHEAKRQGVSIKLVRPSLARQLGVSPGTIESIRKGRIKELSGRIERAIDAAVVRLLMSEQVRVTRELELAKARAESRGGRAMAAMVAFRDQLDALIDEAAAAARHDDFDTAH